MFSRLFIMAFLIALTGCMAEKTEKHNPVNLALNKPCTFNIKPNYFLCSDSADNTQLTDGKIMERIGGEKWFWITKETVGWNNAKKPIEITIDLGEVKPISGFSFHTAFGRADVHCPDILDVMVSENGKDFYEAVEMTNEAPTSTSLESKGYSIYTYKVNDIMTKGRYVRFLSIPNGRYFFCDEIEILSGPAENLKIDLPKFNCVTKSPEMHIMTLCIRKRMLNDIFSLREELEKAKLNAKEKEDICNHLKKLKKEVLEYEFQGKIEGFKAVIPINPLHAEITSTFAEVLEGEGLRGLKIWHKDRYARLALFERPSDEKAQLSVRMMNGEYRADILNITNCEKKTVTVSFQVEGLPGEIKPSYLKVFEVKGVDTKNFKVDFSALVPLSASAEGLYSIDILPGMTGQLWFSFHPETLAPGNYKGIVKLYRDKKTVQDVPMELAISMIKFPDKTDLKCLLWDYSFPAPHYCITEKNFKKAISMMRKEYFINIPVGRALLASYPGKKDFDKTGKLITKLDFSLFDEWVKFWPDATAYHIFLLVTEENNKFAGFNPGSTEFEKAIAEWLTAFSKHVKSKGIDPKKIMFNTLDEPRKPQNYQTLGKWVSAMKKSGAGFSIFSDPVCLERENNMQYAPDALKEVDILCPLLAYYIAYPKDIRDFFEKEKAAGKEIWFYMCTEPNREFDPSYFRLQPWHGFMYGMTGSGFWSFSDTGHLASNWNPYTNPTGYDYSPVYIDEDSITTAKQMEAVREGIEDYQYLLMLRDAVKDDTAKKEAVKVIKSANKLNGINYWKKWDTNKTPCSFADDARNEILDRLEQTME